MKLEKMISVNFQHAQDIVHTFGMYVQIICRSIQTQQQSFIWPPRFFEETEIGHHISREYQDRSACPATSIHP